MRLSSIRGFIRDVVEEGVKEALAPLAPYLRKISGGVVLMALSFFSFAITLFGLAVAIFFATASLPYGAAALWTALVFFIVGLAFLGTGIGLIRKPRRY